MLCGIAISRFGIRPADFYEMTPVEFDEALKDFAAMESQKLETLIKTQYEAMRLQTFHLINISPYVKHKPTKPVHFMPFVWDKPPEQAQTMEDQKRVLMQIANHFNSENKKK